MESITITRGVSLSASSKMRSLWVSVRSRKESALRSSRRARNATCWADSSPLTYSTLSPTACDKEASICSSRVDLPIPGSPPSNTTEPATNPPPSTRSSSLRPVGVRIPSTSGTSPKVQIAGSALPGRPRVVAPLWEAITSIKLFQAPHSPHWPDHLGAVAPQAWHWKAILDFTQPYHTFSESFHLPPLIPLYHFHAPLGAPPPQ